MTSTSIRPQRAIIGGEISSTAETYEAVRGGDGVVRPAAGNVSLVAHEGVVVRPLHRVSPSEPALVWRRDDIRPLVRGYVEACRSALAGTAGSGGFASKIK
ncbi:hypothetical protein AB0H42_12420 [Nocardia sp. NPDC050799]|uniref:hypothetical protein n=1 Tax=Nocardia sp. NPDC050799 TaxID=3154842 RepID=UPI00340EBC7A